LRIFDVVVYTLKDMPQSRQSKFADNYKQKSGGIDKRALRGLRRSLDWKQSRSQVVGQRRNMEGSANAMSPVTESGSDSARTGSDSQVVTQSSKSGEHQVFALSVSLKHDWTGHG